MSSVYFDSSAFIKILVQEQGSGTAIQAWLAARDVAVNRLLYAEARAALAGAKRSRRLSLAQHVQAKSDLHRLWQDLTVLEPVASLIELAGDLAEAEALRGYDAVHLASALSAGVRIFVTADTDLLVAARARGLNVIDTRS